MPDNQQDELDAAVTEAELRVQRALRAQDDANAELKAARKALGEADRAALKHRLEMEKAAQSEGGNHAG